MGTTPTMSPKTKKVDFDFASNFKSKPKVDKKKLMLPTLMFSDENSKDTTPRNTLSKMFKDKEHIKKMKELEKRDSLSPNKNPPKPKLGFFGRILGSIMCISNE